jgi:hypothetical protein
MAIMSEEQVQEARAPYAAPAETAEEEHIIERLQVQFPPYFDRFLEEQDRRVASELNLLEAAVGHNGAEIARLLRDMDRRFAEAQEERQSLRTEMHSQFRWTIGLLSPLVAGMLAIIIRVFFVGTF